MHALLLSDRNQVSGWRSALVVAASHSPRLPHVLVHVQYGFHPVMVAEISSWNVVLFEIVRQVYVHCDERGVILERARKRLMELLAAGDMWCQAQARARLEAEVSTRGERAYVAHG